ncbi:lipoyl protein ligase domain-containing protein [Desertimonas flava]|uniref:lipoyl protein ligase domain-containing protein n=1 Tax=Desertimonas flava TaxID=2064846 RepID=UPI000E34BA4D|nr:hypothetical protein [Desertimonas flava]
MTVAPFAVERFTGTPGAFHATELLDDPVARVVVADATADALVLGSSQPLDVADEAACAVAGVELTKRRSGGGAVLVEVGAMCWFDVVVPVDDPRFAGVAGDVTGSMVWLGRHIAAALADLGVAGVAVHDEAMVCTPWSRLVCFAGVGGGEGLVDGAKLVGISQRRRRQGARFQCMVHTAWHPDRMLGLLRPPKPAATDLPAVATVPIDVATALPAAVAARLSA